MAQDRLGRSPYSRADSPACSYSIGWDWIGDSPTSILVIVNRHHVCAKHGHYLITMGYCHAMPSYNAIVDDHGNLVIVNG